jgi:hypothetical protein
MFCFILLVHSNFVTLNYIMICSFPILFNSLLNLVRLWSVILQVEHVVKWGTVKLSRQASTYLISFWERLISCSDRCMFSCDLYEREVVLCAVFFIQERYELLIEQVDRILLIGSHKLSGGIMNTVWIACCGTVHVRGTFNGNVKPYK